MTTALPLAGPTRRPRGDRLPAVIAAIALALALSAAVQGTLLVVPLLTMHVVDGVIQSRNLDTLAVLSIAVAVALVLGGMMRALRAALLAVLAERLRRRLELRALTASVRAALGGDRTRPALVLQDVAELRRLLGGSLPGDLLDLVAIPVALGFLWLLHPLFFLVGLVALAMKTALGFIAERATRTLLAAGTAAAARCTGELTAWLRQRDTVLGLGLLPAMLRRWTPDWLRALEQQDDAQRRVKALQGLLLLAGFGQQIATVTAGAWLMIRQECSPGAMMAATMMVALVTGPVVAFTARWRDWAYGLLAWRRLRRLAVEQAEPVPHPPEPAPAGLVFEHVSVQPPGAARCLVGNLTLRLAPGEAWALLGPNGVGKTSVLRAVLGLAPPAVGRVLLDGQDTYAADRATLGPRIGYLPQEAELLEGSVLENIGRFAAGPAAEVVAAARLAGAHGAIGRLHRGYDTPVAADATLSGGQRRLVALARALHGRPRLLVLDEPEAGLDAPARAALRQAVAAARTDGTIVLLVTHQPAAWAGALDGLLHLRTDATWQAERPGEGGRT